MTEPKTASVVEQTLPKCRTFSADGQRVICDKPGRYIAWGHLYDKADRGPKCFQHLPRSAKQGGLGTGSPAVFDLLKFGNDLLNAAELANRAEASPEPTLDEVEQALFDAEAAGEYAGPTDLIEDCVYDPHG